MQVLPRRGPQVLPEARQGRVGGMITYAGAQPPATVQGCPPVFPHSEGILEKPEVKVSACNPPSVNRIMAADSSLYTRVKPSPHVHHRQPQDEGLRHLL